MAICFAAALLAACDGSDESYDAENDCRQTIACIEETQSVNASLDDCAAESMDNYAEATAAQRAGLDAAYHACRSERSCDYVECVAEQQGVEVDEGSFGPTTPVECEEVEPLAGEVPSSAGSFAYSDVDIRLWLNGEGCLTEVDVELKSGDCNVTFMGDGLIDADGRYLITQTRVDARSLCPGYPMGLSGLAFESHREAPFGTIEVRRAAEPWSTCAPGEVIVSPNGTATIGLDQDVTFSGSELRFTGTLKQTHHDPSGGCPPVYP